MKLEKLKNKSIKELLKEYTDRKQKMYAYQLDIKSGKEKDTSKVVKLKKDVARILTLINQQSINDGASEKTEVAKEENK